MCDYCISFISVYDWFFFFKQKTAYEMRISDWSSDVCSSDLDPDGAGSRDTRAVRQLQALRRPESDPGGAEGRRLLRPARAGPGPDANGPELGRDACRERVWQFR